ncbi:hypothetical protein ABLE92_24985 [Gordonia sp. VNQ95]|uniref:hypothetical protein n=1 Tax=Gordonia sp. VNQ95 TaxID=3156619 RepID=UPI0032B3E2E9
MQGADKGGCRCQVGAGGDEAGDTEIEQRHLLDRGARTVAGDHDVARLDVAVNDISLVRVVQRRRGGRDYRADVAWTQRLMT